MTAPRLLDRERTAALVGYPALVDALAIATVEYSAGRIASPTRLSVPLSGEGVMLSMPASASDIAIHKLVSVQRANAQRGLPTLHGVVTVVEAATGRPLCFLDGPELTGRRTAAISMLAVRTFMARSPTQAVLIGTGAQAAFHVAALRVLHPDCEVLVKGTSRAAEDDFCERHRGTHPRLAPCPPAIPSTCELVVTLTTSKEAVYDEAATPRRLVIGVGAFKPEMAELGARTLAGSDVYADDPTGARHEAGDLQRAGIDWGRVMPLSHAVANGARRDVPVVVKSVGCAAWDLAAARVAVRALAG
ncbi:bifunctional Delta(1)-pyrroline-2-carboxylate/Delta(1)-piperideine-2-carboxylate reductase [Ramlibacter sp.]|uniref:bifunctional Delta(1)-pyrroline-2-carboxylate/Delta(1)-piperideine-2- carboxylate reductase n=1 Tax=Ramlibacter sp. TaxID=1917967 RepID=UPI003D0CAD34